MELGELTFDDDCMYVALDICGMSDNLKAEIDKAIEVAKINASKEREALNAEHGFNLSTVWSDKVVIDFTYLRVMLEAGKPINYQICTGFTDSVDPMAYGDCAITVDLSEYEDELKKTIIKALVDKFF